MLPQDQWQTGFVFLNIDDPAVAWMVYRGELVAGSPLPHGSLSFFTAERLREVVIDARADRWISEVQLEIVRRSNFAHEASRLSGFYVFADRASAQAAASQWGVSHFREELCEEVAIRPDSVVSRYDAEWITEKLAFDPSEAWMRRYLAGEAFSPNPIWELVVDGTALIYGTDVRTRAYDVVKAEWPKSLALLELARIAAWLDFPLGRSTVFLRQHEQTLRAEYIMAFDANDPAFLNALGAYEGPRNAADLHAAADLVLPDLRDRSFTLPLVVPGGTV